MAVTFDIGNGAKVHVTNNTHPMDTQRGLVPANAVIQGDFIRNIGGDPRKEVVDVPVVS